MNQCEMLRNRIVNIPQKSRYVFERENELKDEENSAFVLCYQIGNSKEVRAGLAWIISFIKPKYFAELRTKQQLGKKTSLKIFNSIQHLHL